uniref:THAP-type domain-containing protein n=1 Tax=Oryzias latipes TaxID=8090 RepID=A0A3P9JUS6_ORYLA
MPSPCVAAGCSNTSSESVSVYKFPKQETLLKQWTKQVQRTRANWVPTASSTLCSEHFEADYMGMHVRYKKVLKPNAIPTIFKRSLVGTSETETPSTSTGSSQYKKRKSVTEKLAQKRVSLTLSNWCYRREHPAARVDPVPTPASQVVTRSACRAARANPVSTPALSQQPGNTQRFAPVGRKHSAKRKNLEHPRLHVSNRLSPLSNTPVEPSTLVIG